MTRQSLAIAAVFSIASCSLAGCGSGGSGNEGQGAGGAAGAGETGGSAASAGAAGMVAGRGGSSGLAGAVGAGGELGGSGGGAGTATAGRGGGAGNGGAISRGGSGGAAGASNRGGAPGTGGSSACGSVAGSGPIGTLTDPTSATDISPPNPPGITFHDTEGNLVNAHGGGIIQVCDTFYLHGEFFLSNSTANNFNGFAMYSSKDLATWKNEGIILPQQPSGELGPNRKGERPHIIKCPATGEFVLYAHAADETYQADKEVVYATSPTVNGIYAYKGPLKNASGAVAAHSDMSAFTDGNNAYVIAESGNVYPLTADCHSWTGPNRYGQVNGTTGGIEAPTVFKAGNTFYWLGSDKTGWRANDNFYSTAPAMTGPWTYQGYLAPQGKKTWMSQSTWVLPVTGSKGTVYVYWGDHWDGTQDTTAPGKHNYLTTYVFQPIVFNGNLISLPTYQKSWKLDVGAGTWSTN
jgi:hypothetical protein